MSVCVQSKDIYECSQKFYSYSQNLEKNQMSTNSRKDKFWYNHEMKHYTTITKKDYC